MNATIIFNKQQYNFYKIDQLSNNRLLNFIAQLISNDSGINWIIGELELQNTTHNKIHASGYIIYHHECCEDDITIIDENALCETEEYNKNCTEPNCCNSAKNKERMEFSRSKLIALLEEWGKLINKKPETIELTYIIYKNEFELKAI